MLKIYSLISVLFSILLLIGCISRFESPKLEFVSLRHFQLRDTVLFKDMQYYPYILRFTSDKELKKSGDDNIYPLLYASAQKRDFDYGDVIKSGGVREGEVFSTAFIEEIYQKNNKYYYAAVLSPTISKEDFRYVNDTVYCKIFYVRMFQSIPQTEEMKIPKDSLNVLFD